MFIDPIKERCVRVGRYLVSNHSTVRATARVFGISKSTVHKDLTEVLEHIDYSLYLEAKAILETNKMERHLRGGEATRQKYAKNLKL